MTGEPIACVQGNLENGKTAHSQAVGYFTVSASKFNLCKFADVRGWHG